MNFNLLHDIFFEFFPHLMAPNVPKTVVLVDLEVGFGPREQSTKKQRQAAAKGGKKKKREMQNGFLRKSRGTTQTYFKNRQTRPRKVAKSTYILLPVSVLCTGDTENQLCTDILYLEIDTA